MTESPNGLLKSNQTIQDAKMPRKVAIFDPTVYFLQLFPPQFILVFGSAMESFSIRDLF